MRHRVRRSPLVAVGALAALAASAGVAAAGQMATGPAGVVVASHGTVSRVAPRTLALAPLAGAPHGVAEVAGTADAYWLAGRASDGGAVVVERLDASGRTRSTRIPGVTDVLEEVASGRSDWVLAVTDARAFRLYRIDGAALSATPVALGALQPFGLAADGAGVWALGMLGGPLVRVNQGGRVMSRAPVSGATTALTSVPGGVLVGTKSGNVVRVSGGRVVRRAPAGGTPFVLASGAGAAYVAALTSHSARQTCWTLARIDPVRLTAAARRQVCGPANFIVGALTVASGDVWALESPGPDRYRLRRLDAATLTPRGLAPLT